MLSRTKLGLYALIILGILVVSSHLLKSKTGWKGFESGSTYTFEYKSESLMKVVQKSLAGKTGTFAVYIENLNSGEKYGLNENQGFPAASLYKLILMAAVLKEVEGGRLSLDDTITNTKSHLQSVLGEVDFGYEERSESIQYTVDEALTRVGAISDNFAAIMLTEKLAQVRASSGSDEKLLFKMTDELGMKNTSFDSDPIITTAFDIGGYFKAMYWGQVVSKPASDKIIDLLGKSKINDRIPAKLPEGTKVIHKTGELSRIRHDGGIVYPPNTPNHPDNPYVIILLSKDLQFEDDGVETLAQLSKDVYDYFEVGVDKK